MKEIFESLTKIQLHSGRYQQFLPDNCVGFLCSILKFVNTELLSPAKVYFTHVRFWYLWRWRNPYLKGYIVLYLCKFLISKMLRKSVVPVAAHVMTGAIISLIAFSFFLCNPRQALLFLRKTRGGGKKGHKTIYWICLKLLTKKLNVNLSCLVSFSIVRYNQVYHSIVPNHWLPLFFILGRL